MRGTTHLRSVRDTGERGSVPVTAEHVPETRGSWLETTRLPSLIDDMERMMNEMFRRPFFETGMTPFRGFLHDIGRGSLSPSVDVFEAGGTNRRQGRSARPDQGRHHREADRQHP